MNRIRRVLCAALIAVGLLAVSAGPALAHATLLGATPGVNGTGVSEGQLSVALRFSEPVQILNRSDVSVVNQRNRQVDTGGAHVVKGNPEEIIIPLRGPLLPYSYTVRYRVVSADSHAVTAAFVFGVGHAKLGEPILAGSGGISDTSAASVAARAVELTALGLLVGLIAFRLLIWGPAVEGAGGLSLADRASAMRNGRKAFWRAFWALAILAGLAETAVLAAKSAVVFHTGMIGALTHPTDAYRLVAASRFGDLLGWRCGALLVLVALAFVVWNAESAEEPVVTERPWSLALMGLFGVAALTLLADQGHASQAPLAPLSVATDAVHLAGASIWVGGLACLIAVLVRAPRALPEGGRTLASATLKRFSKVALWSIVVISVTGLLRMVGELSSPAQLWETGYGRDLMLKASLLIPILLIARRNRRFVSALSGGLTPSAARLKTVARSVQMELAIAAGIIVVAALLVAQIPGRT